jgi:hypothetical protein
VKTAATIHKQSCVVCNSDALVTIPTATAVKGYCGEHVSRMNAVTPEFLSHDEIQALLTRKA